MAEDAKIQSMISITNLVKTFKSGGDRVRAVDGVSLEVGEREFFVLLGLSGSGKTTLLRCVAGLEKPDEGEIVINNKLFSSAARDFFIGPEGRGLGMVFQSYAVWPHMTVFENVAFPLANGPHKLSGAEIKKKVTRALELVQLAGLADRPAPFLSGGQQQRVALARALAVEPKVLLMDEPLSNLDARLREEVRDEIKNLAKGFGIAVLYVTHDQVEAMALADRVAVMSKGKLLQCAPPRELYEAPAGREVCEFLGSTNLLDGIVSNGDKVTTDLGELICARLDPKLKQVSVAIRPEELELSATPSGRENEFFAEVVATTFLGELTVCDLQVGGRKLRFKSTQRTPPARRIYVRLPADKLKLFARS
ncbi:MAG TPA: ABC transporter ATP-binding protein [Methylomirabilota bacterium]|nr:ABC transporter ATP-binding protein [Methylomirabilota bacterium]